MSTFTINANDPAIADYYDKLSSIRKHATHEQAIRQAFADLLSEVSKKLTWTLILEPTLDNRARPDGVLFDSLRIPRGYWEAKDTDDNLDVEITKKIERGYPTFNLIFENSERGVLYQYGKVVLDVDLRSPSDLAKLLSRFFSYTGEDIEKFNAAVREFQERIPRLAQGLIARIDEEFIANMPFQKAFAAFHTLCRNAMHPDISRGVVEEMLVQHLLTERLFRTIFNNPEFVQRNVIAAEIEKVITALTSQTFSRSNFLGNLNTVYHTIEENARRIEDFTAKQPFLNVVYERFFHGFSVKQADTHGIIYTPQAIVDFMCASVEELLQQEFNLTLAAPSVQILDPCVGTGNFMLNLLHRIPKHDLTRKYEQELFCNEVLLLPYYIASLNIEHAYYTEMEYYKTFPGICLVDTLNLAERQQHSFFNEENSLRVARQKEAQLMVIIGNPPYNVGQQNENDNNKNLPYPVIDEKIRTTYAKDSKATLKMQLYDAYVRFFRWAIDRLEDRDGIVCFVTNNGFLDGIAFDGFRKHFAQEFTTIYHLNLGGNARKQGGGNVFGIKVGVGITVLIRNRTHREHSDNTSATIWYYVLDSTLTGEEKLVELERLSSPAQVPWQELYPDTKQNWLTEGLHATFAAFLPMGTKAAKTDKRHDVETMFKLFSNGVKTNRDTWVYNFNDSLLSENIQRFIDAYNDEVDRWKRESNESNKGEQVDNFVTYDAKIISWSGDLKLAMKRGQYATYLEDKIRVTLYRPFCKQYLFFDRIMNNSIYLFHRIFPTPASEAENVVICVAGIGDRKGFGCLASCSITSLDLAFEKTQCFPFYTYDEDGNNRRENITDWALRQFQEHYDIAITKWDIFHYTYAMLHHPGYRERYAENLKRELPRIPMLGTSDTFTTLAAIGQKLMHLHLHYETAAEHPALEWVENKAVPWSWRVQKMKLNREKTAVIVNQSLTITGIPESTFSYRLGSRSALEWVIDQYQVKTDKRSGITNDPNRGDDPEYIARLIGRVVTVSVETVALVERLGAEVDVG